MSFATRIIFLILNFVSCPSEAESQSNYTKVPPSPSLVLEGNELFLQWNYTLGESLREAEIDLMTNGPINVATLSALDLFQKKPVFIHGPFVGRVEANITDTQTNFTILKVNRTDSGKYVLRVVLDNAERTELDSEVIITVLFEPEIIKPLVNDSTVCEGDVITITCSADSRPAVHTYQLFENEQLDVDGNSSAGVWILRNELKEGNVSYRCVANNTIGTTEETVNITVKVPSKVYPLENITVVEGENRTLTCNASGSMLTVTWTEVSTGNRSNGLIRYLTNISRNDAGEYKCEAINDCGTSSASTFLTVLFKPEIIKPLVNDSSVCEGDIINVTCSAVSRPAVHTYQLFENGVLVDGNSSAGVSILRSDLKGGNFSYRCVANNTVGTTEETVNITVKVPFSIIQVTQHLNVTEGVSLTLMCNVSGVPLPMVSWMTPNGQCFSGYKLEVENVSRSEAGEYKCEASNECGNATELATIDVHYASKITNISGEQNVNSGEEVSLFCMAEGNPVPTITWTKIADNSTVNFPLTIRGSQDEGLYRCTAENGVGSPVNKDVNMTIHFPASIVAMGNQTAVKGDTIVLYCNVSGMPPPTFLWTHVKSGGTWNQKKWTIEGIQVENLGEYRCNASNKYGGDIKSTFIMYGDFVTDPGPVPSEPTKVNKDVIYGLVIGVLALILAVLTIFIAWKHRKREKDDRLNRGARKSRTLKINEGFELESSNGNLNTIAHHGPGHYMDLNEVRSLNGPATDPTRSYLEINEYAPLHPRTRLWEVERENITIEKVIGKGAFGQVAQGKASNLRGREETITVAIKMLKGNARDLERKDLLSELEIMKKLKPHPHVIKLLGCVTKSDPLLVLIEYVPYGDLRGYLRKSRHLEDNYFKDPDVKPQTSLTSQQLMKFSWQVADGMHYLSSKNIIHRDLAARNVLVGERERCKVTDFGMARDVCQENIYERKSKGRLPVKWTASEALLYGRYTTKSDVWSFGIVLYEIFTIGGSPYPRIDGRKIAHLLSQGYRMPKPRHVDDILYKIMQDCWQENPDDRPMFESLRNDLKEMENQHQRLINMQLYDNILYTSVG